MFKKMFLLCTITCFSLYASEEFRRIHMIFGSDQTLSPEEKFNPGFDVQDLTMAILEEASPIIIGKKLLIELLGYKIIAPIIISRYSMSQQALSELNLLLVKHPKLSDIDTLRESSPEYAALKTIPIHELVYYQLHLTNDAWFLFDCSGGNFVMLLPKRYVRSILGSDQIEILMKEEKKLGLKISACKQLMLPEAYHQMSVAQQIFKDLENSASHKKEAVIDDLDVALKKIFFIKEIGKEDEYPYVWNIYVAGHGLTNPTQIAGLPLKQFRQLIHFCNTHIKTNFFYYVTCFGGGIHLTLPYEPFKGTINFPIASATTLEAEVVQNWLSFSGKRAYRPLTILNGILVPEPSIQFSRFFQDLETNKPFDEALRFVADFHMPSNKIPLIRFPGLNAFTAAHFKDKVTIINSVGNKAHLLDQKPFNISDRVAILLYAPVIPNIIRFDFKNKPMEIFLMANQKDQYIESIEVNDLYLFLRSFFHGGSTLAQPKVLYVNSLKTHKIGTGLKKDDQRLPLPPEPWNVKAVIKNEDSAVYFSFFNSRGQFFKTIVPARGGDIQILGSAEQDIQNVEKQFIEFQKIADEMKKLAVKQRKGFPFKIRSSSK